MQKFELEYIQSIDNAEKIISGVSESLTSACAENAWPDALLLKHALDQSIITLNEHFADLTKYGRVLVQKDGQAEEMAKDVQSLFKQWHIDKNPPSLLSMCLFLIENLSLKPEIDDICMLTAAAVLGQVQNDVPYHSDMHFRKVVSQVMRLVVANNQIFDATSRILNAKQICRLLAAACIHDLGHEGQGNVIKGVHIEGRAEKASFERAKPYLEAAGADEDTLKAIYVMLLTTDVSPLDDPTNPMMQMKAAYRYHFMGDDMKVQSLNLSPELKILEKDSALTTLCLLLHEADIATSAAITYEVTKFETALLMEEVKDDKAYPKDVVSFLDQICQRRFISDAGQKLYAANLARIYTLAKSDVEEGNEAYPSSVHADFNIPLSNIGDSQTIN